ncbi:unnamed protein product [Orchesella dallaii]|uniref:Uncharacterized protein n=1 Tax=Orchesella dallaii TaxID=48710 RepID=A0ABP1QRB2_9HEXA
MHSENVFLVYLFTTFFIFPSNPSKVTLISLIQEFYLCDVFIIKADKNELGPLSTRHILMEPLTSVNMEGWLPPPYAKHFRFPCTAIFILLSNSEKYRNSTDIEEIFLNTPLLLMKTLPQFMFFVYNLTQEAPLRNSIWSAVKVRLFNAVPDVTFLTTSNSDENQVLKVSTICRFCSISVLKIQRYFTVKVKNRKSSDIATEIRNLSVLDSRLEKFFWVFHTMSPSNTISYFPVFDIGRHQFVKNPNHSLKKFTLEQVLQYTVFASLTDCESFNRSNCEKFVILPPNKRYKYMISSKLQTLIFPSLEPLYHNKRAFPNNAKKNKRTVREGEIDIVLHETFYNFLTCDQVSKKLGFDIFIRPLDQWVWILTALCILAITMGLACVVVNDFTLASQNTSGVLLEIVGVLVEKPMMFHSTRKSFRIFMFFWWLSCVVITNAYRGVFTTGIIIPTSFTSPWSGFDKLKDFRYFSPNTDFYRHMTRSLQAVKYKYDPDNPPKEISIPKSIKVAWNFFQLVRHQSHLVRKYLSYTNDTKYFEMTMTEENCQRKAYVDTEGNIDGILKSLNQERSQGISVLSKTVSRKHAKFVKGSDLLFVKPIGWKFLVLRDNYVLKMYKRLVPTGILLFWGDLYKRFKPDKHFDKLITLTVNQTKSLELTSKTLNGLRGYWKSLSLEDDSYMHTCFFMYAFGTAFCLVGFCSEVFVSRYYKEH